MIDELNFMIMNDPNNLNENYYFTKGNTHLPTVVLNKAQNKFEFSGVSMPEDSLSFYLPILEWLDTYKQEPNEKTIVIFKMSYINSSSSKMMDKIFNKLDEMYLDGHNVVIQWHYHIDDEDMFSDGKIYLEEKSFPYEFINYGTEHEYIM